MQQRSQFALPQLGHHDVPRTPIGAEQIPWIAVVQFGLIARRRPGQIVMPQDNAQILVSVMPSLCWRGISLTISLVAHPWQRFLTAFGMTRFKGEPLNGRRKHQILVERADVVRDEHVDAG
jgi:hypothetical protein